MKIFILGSYGPSLTNFRGDMIKAMIEEGHEVYACSPDDYGNTGDKVEAIGAKYIPITMQRTGMNPLNDISLIFSLIKKIKKVKPDVFLSYTIKPNIYGSLAAHFSGVSEIYGMMTGAGSMLRTSSPKMSLLQSLIKPLYRVAFSKCKTLFFLNKDDIELFKKEKLIKRQKIIALGSSGVNLKHFNKKTIKNTNTFLFIARLIKDKGIYEYLEAACIAKKMRPEMNFLVVGPFDSNPTAINKDELKKWSDKGVIEYKGETNDVRPYIEESFVVVLPSYHEGQGRVLVEAMAMGRAVIATDVSGCRQTINNGEAGFLIPVKDSKALAEKMIELYDNPELTMKMAEKGFVRTQNVYDVNKINEKILNEMNLLS